MTDRENENEDEIDLVSLFLIIWKRRKLIVLGTLGVTLLAAIYSFTIPKGYLSTGFYQLGVAGVPLGVGGVPISSLFDKFDKFDKFDNEGAAEQSMRPFKDSNELTIPSFKNSATQFYNPERLKFYADHKKTLNSWEKVTESLNTSEDIRKRIKQIYAHSKEDVREVGSLSADQKNVIIGVELSYETDIPQRAHDVVAFLGEYVKDCLSYDHLFHYVQNGFNTAELEFSRNENSIMDHRFKILQLTNKALDIQSILTKYPDSARIEDRQLVSIQGGGYHYLSPVSQLVGIESNLADLRRKLAEFERAKEKLVISKAYFSKCKDMMEKADKSGDYLLSQLPIIKSELVKDMDASQDITKEAVNNISLDIQRFTNLYTNYRFISGPSIPEKHIKPNKRVIVMVTFFASFFLLVMMTFILEWWQKNKEIIQTSNLKQLGVGK
jgi:Chain length determinant protein